MMDGEGLQGVFLVGAAAGEYDIGPEPVHREWLVQPAVQLVQRGLTDQQEGVAIGKGSDTSLGGIAGIRDPGRFIGHMYEAAVGVQCGAEPVVGFPAYKTGGTGVVPDADNRRRSAG